MNGRLFVRDYRGSFDRQVSHLLQKGGFTVAMLETDAECLDRLREAVAPVVIINAADDAEPALSLIRRARSVNSRTLAVLVTAQASLRLTVEAVSEGAFDIVPEASSEDQFIDVVTRACAAGESAPAASPVTHRSEGPLLGRSPAMMEVYKVIARVASTRATVLVTGESGSGKEVVAKAIHDLSPRSTRPCVVIDCAAIPPALLESELFGHVRGAFTGAIADKRGLIEQAHQSSCMLDEVGELALELQAKLLRLLQQGEVRRVGAQARTVLDVRVIAATNRDLGRLVSEGKFREDLFYRLNVVTIQLPPLRERLSDVPLLAHRFLLDAAVRHNRPANSFSRGAMRRLTGYHWPGNVRQLQNTIERAVALSDRRVIVEDDLPVNITEQPVSCGDAGPAPLSAIFSSGETLEDVKRRYILHVVSSTRGNIARAAAQLDVDRRSLYRMLERYKVPVPGRDVLVA